MSDYVHTITSHAVASELDHPAIDLNHPDLNDPMEYQDSDSSSSDCESIISVDQSGLRLVPFISSGLVELSEGDMVRRFLEDRFLWRVGALREQVTVVAIHQNGYSSVSAKGRARAFQACSEAVEKKGNGNSANVRYAWYAASRKEVSEIFSHGFGYSGKPENSGLYGRGLYFAPENHLLESVKVAPMDEEGLRHVLLCRVILGKPELVSFGSEQSHPSSEQYDSSIDDLSSPTRYIVWSTHMNTHVLPEYVISFRAPCHLRVLLRTLEKSWKPTSPRVTLSSLVAKLSKILLPSDANLMSEYYKDYKGGKISRHVLIQKVKQMGGKFADWNHQKILEISKKEREVAGYGTMEGLE